MANVVIILAGLGFERAKLALMCNCICSQTHRWERGPCDRPAQYRLNSFCCLHCLGGYYEAPIHTTLLMSRVYIRDAREQLAEQLMK